MAGNHIDLKQVTHNHDNHCCDMKKVKFTSMVHDHIDLRYIYKH